MANKTSKLLHRLLALNLPGLHQLRSSLIRAFLLNLIAQVALGTPSAAQVAGKSCRALAHITLRHTPTGTSQQ